SAARSRPGRARARRGPSSPRRRTPRRRPRCSSGGARCTPNRASPRRPRPPGPPRGAPRAPRAGPQNAEASSLLLLLLCASEVEVLAEIPLLLRGSRHRATRPGAERCYFFFEPDFLPPRLEAPGEFAIFAARSFDIPFL